MVEMNNLSYKLGGLLYVPANNNTIVNHIRNNDYDKLTSIVFCLEDSIMDEYLEESERFLLNTLLELEQLKNSNVKIPFVFIRVRTPNHLNSILKKYEKQLHILTGFILPKFDDSNAKTYRKIIKK